MHCLKNIYIYLEMCLSAVLQRVTWLKILAHFHVCSSGKKKELEGKHVRNGWENKSGSTPCKVPYFFFV